MESENYSIHICNHMLELIKSKKVELGSFCGRLSFMFSPHDVLDKFSINYCPVCGKEIKIEERKVKD